MKRQSGFTLVEMVAVIIILAIMAATALPKFTSLTGEARLSSIQGMAGGVRSAAALVKAKWLIAQSGLQDTVELVATAGLQPVSVIVAASDVAASGYPTPNALGILAALDATNGYQSGVDASRWAFWPEGVVTSSSCAIYYESGQVTQNATLAGCQ